jgi:hypothetical protein
MTIPSISEKRKFRGSIWPIFAFFFVTSSITGVITICCSVDVAHRNPILFGVILAVAFTFSAAGTFYFYWFGGEVLSTKGIEVWLILLGYRLLPWTDVAAVYTFSPLKLVCIKFKSTSGQTNWRVLFQRRKGDFRQMITDLVPKDHLIWEKLNDA